MVLSYLVLIQNRLEWSPLATGAFKLNSDGSISGNPRLAGIRGIICGSNASHIPSYVRLVGLCLANKAELLALRIALLEALQLNLYGMVAEGDSFSPSVPSGGPLGGTLLHEECLMRLRRCWMKPES